MTEDKEPRGPIFPGIIMLIAGTFLIITSLLKAEEMSGKLYLKITAGLMIMAYGVYRIKRR